LATNTETQQSQSRNKAHFFFPTEATEQLQAEYNSPSDSSDQPWVRTIWQIKLLRIFLQQVFVNPTILLL